MCNPECELCNGSKQQKTTAKLSEIELHDEIVEIMRSGANQHQIGVSNSAYRIIKLFKEKNPPNLRLRINK